MRGGVWGTRLLVRESSSVCVCVGVWCQRVCVCVCGVCGGGLGHNFITYNRVVNLNAK